MNTDNIIKIKQSLLEAKTVLENLINDNICLNSIDQASKIIIDSIKSKNKLFICGNGGSMCDSIHFAEELSGKFRDDRPGLPAIAISDPGHMSCVSNDYGYEFVFSRYLSAHAKENDVLVCISTSGNSQNCIKASEYAKNNNIRVISLTGIKNSPLSKYSDIDITTVGYKYADRVQELHIKVIHILIELIERNLFPKNY